MMMAKSPTDFDQANKKFTQLASPSQLLYIEKNWMNCKEKWVAYFRTDASNTNNHVESVNSKLKMFIRKHSKMDECLNGIFNYIDFLNRKYSFNAYLTRSKIIKYKDVEANDPIIDEFYKSTTKTLANYLLVQYQSSKFEYEVEEYDSANQDLNELTIYSSKNFYTVSDLRENNQKCTCHNYKSNSLPCKHIFYVRRLLKLKEFESTMIPERFRLSYASSFIYKGSRNRKSVVTLDDCDNIEESAPKQKSCTAEEKYNLMWRPMQELCQCFSRFNDDEFDDKLSLFMLIKEYFEKKVFNIFSFYLFSIYLNIFFF